MVSFFASIRLWLETNIHPAAPWALLTLAIFVAVYATRKLTPKLWVWFDSVTPDGMIAHVVQGLPAVLTGAVASAFLAGGDIADAWKGALAGALAPVLHLFLKAVPVPYQGAVRVAAKKVGIVDPISGAGLLLLMLLLSGCAGSFEEARGNIRIGATPEVTERCYSLDSIHRTWGGIGKASGGLAAGAGVVAALPDVEKDARVGLAIGGAVTGAVAAGAIFVSESAASSWAAECSK